MEELAGIGEIGIELENALEVLTGFIRVAERTGEARKIHADRTAPGGPGKGIAPECECASLRSGLRFHDSEIDRGVDIERIDF